MYCSSPAKGTDTSGDIPAVPGCGVMTRRDPGSYNGAVWPTYPAVCLYSWIRCSFPSEVYVRSPPHVYLSCKQFSVM